MINIYQPEDLPRFTRRQFCKAAAIGAAATLLPPVRQARGATTFFHHTAETSPICCSDSSAYQFSLDQPAVTRSTDIGGKSGSWALRHDVVLPGDNQTGKVLKFIAPWTGLPGSAEPGHTDRYFSCWFYFPAGGKFSTNWNNVDLWTNNFEWKCDTHSAYQDGTSVQPPIGAKVINSIQWIGGAPRWYTLIYTAKFVPGGPGTAFPLGYFPHNVGSNAAGWANTSFAIPFGEWVFFEVHIKASEGNGQLQIWSGKASDGQLHLLIDMSDPALNTLTMWNSSLGNYSSNRFLYWSLGNYLDSAHSAGTWRLYTDDHRITDFQVGPTLPEFAAAPPPPATIGRNPASGRIESTGRIPSVGRIQ